MSAVFRVIREKDYTVMANHHLRNRDLSLKAKGLLSVMLSLPENWDYSIRGLVSLSRDGEDSVRNGLHELERAKYVVRKRRRSPSGQWDGYDYFVYEKPQTPDPDNPQPGDPGQGKPAQVSPAQEEPMTGNRAQLNTYKQNTNLPNTYGSIIHPSYLSMEGMDVDKMRMEIRRQICYGSLVERFGRERVDELVNLMLEVYCTRNNTLSIAGVTEPTAMVQDRLRNLNSFHVEYILSTLEQRAPKIRNIRKYLLACLFNAPSTMNTDLGIQGVRDRREFDDLMDALMEI